MSQKERLHILVHIVPKFDWYYNFFCWLTLWEIYNKAIINLLLLTMYWSVLRAERLYVRWNTPSPRKKEATLIFDITKPSVEIFFFTIFEAPCSGLICAWCNILHTHHRCKAFIWCDVTHDDCQAVACSAYWHRISYHLTYGLWTHQWLKSCWLFFLEYHARQSVPVTHSEYWRVETSASSGVGGAGPQTYCCSYQTVASFINVCDSCVKAQEGYLHLHWIYSLSCG